MTYRHLLSFFEKAHRVDEYLNQDLVFLDTTLRFTREGSSFYYERNGVLKGCFSEENPYFKLAPTLLDRPLVLALESPVVLLPNEQRSLYLERPISLELHLSTSSNQKQSHCIDTFPLVDLKRTAYGKVQNAMVCYHWTSPCYEDWTQAKDLFAVLPLSLDNASKKRITFQKLVIYKNYLQLYLFPSQILTCEVRIKVSSSQDAFIQYDESYPNQIGTVPLHTVTDQEQGSNKFLKRVRFAKRKGTGIEYGF